MTEARTGRALLTGALGGLFSGLTGVGGGAVMVPLLTGLLRMPQHLAHGTSLAIIIFVAALAVLPYIADGDVEWKLAAALAISSTVAAMVGARTMALVPELWLRRVFAVFILFVALWMFLG